MTSSNSAANDIEQMNAQIAQYGSITQFGIRISEISGTADAPNQGAGYASKTDHGFAGYNGTWEVGNWGDTLHFTQDDVCAGIDIAQMNAQIAQYGSITQFGVRVTAISGTANNPEQTSGTAAKTDGGFSGYNGTWEIGNWGDTLKFTR